MNDAITYIDKKRVQESKTSSIPDVVIDNKYKLTIDYNHGYILKIKDLTTLIGRSKRPLELFEWRKELL